MMLKSILCNYSDVYILIKGTLTVAPEAAVNANNYNKEAVFKNCAPFTDCISEINNAQTDNANEIDAVMSIYN